MRLKYLDHEAIKLIVVAAMSFIAQFYMLGFIFSFLGFVRVSNNIEQSRKN